MRIHSCLEAVLICNNTMKFPVKEIVSTVCKDLPSELKGIVHSFISKGDTCSFFQWYDVLEARDECRFMNPKSKDEIVYLKLLVELPNQNPFTIQRCIPISMRFDTKSKELEFDKRRVFYFDKTKRLYIAPSSVNAFTPSRTVDIENVLKKLHIYGNKNFQRILVNNYVL